MGRFLSAVSESRVVVGLGDIALDQVVAGRAQEPHPVKGAVVLGDVLPDDVVAGVQEQDAVAQLDRNLARRLADVVASDDLRHGVSGAAVENDAHVEVAHRPTLDRDPPPVGHEYPGPVERLGRA
jgi:hypothetical protein